MNKNVLILNENMQINDVDKNIDTIFFNCDFKNKKNVSVGNVLITLLEISINKPLAQPMRKLQASELQELPHF